MYHQVLRGKDGLRKKGIRQWNAVSPPAVSIKEEGNKRACRLPALGGEREREKRRVGKRKSKAQDEDETITTRGERNRGHCLEVDRLKRERGKKKKRSGTLGLWRSPQGGKCG